ncbi:hypothetical protein J6590_068155 [Homalodisca vitripennis]|nr:hypothetical protein J6590_068155 [Homalodisca vitripennis]
MGYHGITTLPTLIRYIAPISKLEDEANEEISAQQRSADSGRAFFVEKEVITTPDLLFIGVPSSRLQEIFNEWFKNIRRVYPHLFSKQEFRS